MPSMTNPQTVPLRITPRPVRALTSRVTRSPFAQDLARHGWLSVWCLVILALAFLVGLFTDGVYLTWTGWQEIPSDPPPVDGYCGDYCGTDAGMFP